MTLLLILEAHVHKINERFSLTYDPGGGLCYLTRILREEGLIERHEEGKLDQYIAENGPEEGYGPYGWHRWPQGNIKVRRKWLQERIEIESQNG